MKLNTKTTLLATLILLLTAASPGGAAEVTLTWDAPDAPAEPIGYRIYQGLASGVYDKHADAGTQMEWTMQGLEPGKMYYFAATALYEDGVESGYSNEVSKLIPVIGVPGTLRITGVRVEGQLNFEIDQSN